MKILSQIAVQLVAENAITFYLSTYFITLCGVLLNTLYLFTQNNIIDNKIFVRCGLFELYIIRTSYNKNNNI